MSEHPDSVESLESLVYLGCQASQVHPDQEAKCYLASYLVRMETPVSPVYLDDQVLKVSQVSQEAPAVKGFLAQKVKEEIPVLEANLVHKVSLDPEGMLVFQVVLDRVLMVPEGKMVLRGVLEPRASLETYWEPVLELQERTAYQESQGTRASLGHREDLDHLVAADVTAFLD